MCNSCLLSFILLMYGVLTLNALWFSNKYINKNLDESNLLEFDQLIDHNDTSLGTFKQRYYIDDTYYIPNSNSPLYLTIGGEGPISSEYITTPPMTTYAKQNNALQAVLEHRYYGTSFPYKGANGYSLQSLKYLSVEQALADLKYFVESDIFTNKYSINSNASKILFGCSYSGALSAWSKIQYPNTWTAIVSGSGVIYPLYEYSTYTQWGNMDFLKYSYNCYNNLQTAGQYIVNDLLQTVNGRIYLTQLWNICNTIPSPNDNINAVQQFLYMIIQSLPVQGDNPSHNYPTKQLCSSLNQSDMNVNETLRIWSGYSMYESVFAENMAINYSKSCYNLSGNIGDYSVSDLKNTNVGEVSTWKSWAYQVCTEMGWFQTIHSGQSVLGVNGQVSLEYLSTACSENGMGISNYSGPNVDKLHKEFYGKQISEYITNAFFDYGYNDPWRWVTVTTSWLQPNKNVFLYEHDSSHCASFGKPSVDDTSIIKDERIFIANWLAQFN